MFKSFCLTLTGVTVLALTMAVTDAPAVAKSKRDNSFTGNWHRDAADPHLRYPGDEKLPGGGHVRRKGPDKGVYIEKCRWTVNNTLLGILPLGLTQRCQRYTLENTK